MPFLQLAVAEGARRLGEERKGQRAMVVEHSRAAWGIETPSVHEWPL